MPNATRLYRYEVRPVGGQAGRSALVRADTSASGLTLGGQANTEPPAAILGNTFHIVLPGRGGPNAKVSHARTVTIVMTAGGPPLVAGSRAVIPVFRVDRWLFYEVGQVGTYLGASCRCVDKRDGRPSISGALN